MKTKQQQKEEMKKDKKIQNSFTRKPKISKFYLQVPEE